MINAAIISKYYMLICVSYFIVRSYGYSKTRRVLVFSRITLLVATSSNAEVEQKRLQTFGVKLKGSNDGFLKNSIGMCLWLLWKI